MNESVLLVAVVLSVALKGSVVVQVVTGPFQRSEVNVLSTVEVFVVQEEVLLKTVGSLPCQSLSAVTSELKAIAPSSRIVPILGMVMVVFVVCEGVYQSV